MAHTLRLGEGHWATPMADAGRGPNNPANDLGIAITGSRTKREAFLRPEPEPTAMEEAWVPREEVRGPSPLRHSSSLDRGGASVAC